MSRPVDPRLWRASAAMRHFLVTTAVYGVLISGCTIASAVVLADIVARVITDPAQRSPADRLLDLRYPPCALSAGWD